MEREQPPPTSEQGTGPVWWYRWLRFPVELDGSVNPSRESGTGVSYETKREWELCSWAPHESHQAAADVTNSGYWSFGIGTITPQEANTLLRHTCLVIRFVSLLQPRFYREPANGVFVIMTGIHTAAQLRFTQDTITRHFLTDQRGSAIRENQWRSRLTPTSNPAAQTINSRTLKKSTAGDRRRGVAARVGLVSIKSGGVLSTWCLIPLCF
ncbi:hypothetical protein DPEC_G00161640 [Dallia pectoralis]|uniref:Uncharacterized protein n=1 Tax=Dallia pectoralis TaxID=75939 RepID=A0ACC2GG26_DALPE|nr:hypothetical protein DPEC_G00161640 [Dallia pectoralis]